jgi:hypothetical protein
MIEAQSSVDYSRLAIAAPYISLYLKAAISTFYFYIAFYRPD